VLHHLARSERPRSTRRCPATIRRTGTRQPVGISTKGYAPPAITADESIVYAGLYGVLQTPEEVVALVLTSEGELLASALT
jgi:hypothetical protein